MQRSISLKEEQKTWEFHCCYCCGNWHTDCCVGNKCLFTDRGTRGWCMWHYAKLPLLDREKLIGELLSTFASVGGVHLPRDVVRLSIQASKHLSQSGRSNVLCSLAMALGRMRTDGSDSRLPATRMPLGLLEYIEPFSMLSPIHRYKIYSSDYIIYTRLDWEMSRWLQAMVNNHVF